MFRKKEKKKKPPFKSTHKHEQISRLQCTCGAGLLVVIPRSYYNMIVMTWNANLSLFANVPFVAVIMMCQMPGGASLARL